MMSTSLPAVSPKPASQVYWKAIPDGAKLSVMIRVYRWLVDHSDRNESIPALNRVISSDLNVHPSSVNRATSRLEAEGWIEISGGTRDRTIRVLKWPKSMIGTGAKSSGIIGKSARNITGKSARNPDERKPNGPKQIDEVPAPRSLFERIEFREKENVNVPSLPKTRTREEVDHGKPTATQEALPEPGGLPGSPLAEVGAGCDRGGLAQPHAQAAPRPDPNEGVDPKLVRMSDEELTALVDRLSGSRRIEDRCERIIAQSLLRARQAASGDPPETAQAPRAFAPRESAPTPSQQLPAHRPHVETVDLIGKLATPAGPSMVDVIVRRLCEKLDPAFEPCFRRACADVLAKKLDVRLMQGAWMSCRTAAKPGPAFGAAIKKARLEGEASNGSSRPRRE